MYHAYYCGGGGEKKTQKKGYGQRGKKVKFLKIASSKVGEGKRGSI